MLLWKVPSSGIADTAQNAQTNRTAPERALLQARPTRLPAEPPRSLTKGIRSRPPADAAPDKTRVLPDCVAAARVRFQVHYAGRL